jgi:hypothetical protein
MKIKKNYEFGFLKIFFYSLLTLSIFFIFFEITSRFFVSTVAKNFKVFEYGFNKDIKIDIIHLIKFKIKINDLELLNNSIDEKKNQTRLGETSRIWAFGGSTTRGRNCGKNSSSWPHEVSKLNKNLKILNFGENGIDSYASFIKFQKKIVKEILVPETIIWGHKANEVNIIYQGIRKNPHNIIAPSSLTNKNFLYFTILKVDKNLRDNLIFYKILKNVLVTSARKIIENKSKEILNINLTEDDYKFAAKNFKLNTLNAINLSKKIGVKNFILLSIPGHQDYEDKFKNTFFPHYYEAVKELKKDNYVSFLDLSNLKNFRENRNILLCDTIHKTLKGNKTMADLIEKYITLNY